MTPQAQEQPSEIQQDTMEFPEADPWGSPAMHRGHGHDDNPPKTNGASSSTEAHERPSRTTSTFTTSIGHNSISSLQPGEVPPPRASGVWGSHDKAYSAPSNHSAGSTIGGETYGAAGSDVGPGTLAQAHSRNISSGRATGSGVEEVITVTLLPEKEGMFMFQHHNYQVSSPRRGSKVVRRYSDFVWLLDCLHKRYPFRQLPLLPPKRVAGELYISTEEWANISS